MEIAIIILAALSAIASLLGLLCAILDFPNGQDCWILLSIFLLICVVTTACGYTISFL